MYKKTLLSLTAATLLATSGLALADAKGRHGGHRGMNIDFAAIDADSNGTASRDELIAFVSTRIAQRDTNGDGAIDRSELIAEAGDDRGRGMRNLFGKSRAERRADKILEKLEATEVGQVSVAALAAHSVDRLLSHVDKDEDKAISAEEAEKMDQKGKRRGKDRRERRNDAN